MKNEILFGIGGVIIGAIISGTLVLNMNMGVPNRIEQLKKHRLLSEGGAENKIYDAIENVIKQSKGNISRFDEKGNLRHYSFDPTEKTPRQIRIEIINEYIISKVLNILFKNNVPGRGKLFSKFYPMYEQEKVYGVRNADDVEYKESAQTESPYNQDKDRAKRFKIKVENILTPTEKGQLTLDEWKKNVDEIESKLVHLGIIIDRAVNSSFINFIKNSDGKYFYIDTFSVPNIKLTIKLLLDEVEKKFLINEMNKEEYDKVKKLLKRLVI